MGDSQNLRQFAAWTVLLFNMPFIAKVVLCSTKLTRWLSTIRDKQQKGLMVENRLWSKTVVFNLFMRSGQDCLQEWWSGHRWKHHFHRHHLQPHLYQCHRHEICWISMHGCWYGTVLFGISKKTVWFLGLMDNSTKRPSNLKKALSPLSNEIRVSWDVGSTHWVQSVVVAHGYVNSSWRS